MECQTDKLLNDIMVDLGQTACHINDLIVMGYNEQFEFVGGKLMCISTRAVYYARELAVDYLHHVPEIGYVYGIRHYETNVRGIFVCYTAKTITLK